SLVRYRKVRWLVRGLFRRFDLCAVQTPEYAENFRQLGARPECVQVTGSVKFDGVESKRDNPRTRELGRLLAVEPGDLIWIAGSTQASEEQVVLDIFRRVTAEHPNLRLILVPRQKERFEEVAHLLGKSGL